MSLLEVKNLKVYYKVNRGLLGRKQYLHAVDDVGFTLEHREILGLVGESGCGKSTLGRALVALEKPNSGSILLDGVDITTLSPRRLREFRSNFQMIFQDPYGSLNPRMTVCDTLDEVLMLHTKLDRYWREKKIEQLLETVGLDTGAMNRYPHQFSGGQRQRIGIARALAAQPKFIVADEPVSALDVSVQAQIINLLGDLRQKSDCAFLFIAHDLGVVEHICDRILVMYLGRIVESGESSKVCSDPQHPYTKALLSAVPSLRRKKQKRLILQGDVPSPMNPPHGCPFHPRCPMARPECRETEPMLLSADGEEHYSSCLFPEEVRNL